MLLKDQCRHNMALGIVGDAEPSIGLVHHIVDLEGLLGAWIFMSTFAWIFSWIVMVCFFVPPRYGCQITISCTCQEECCRFRTGLPDPSAHSRGFPFHDRVQRKIAAIEIRFDMSPDRRHDLLSSYHVAGSRSGRT